VENVAAPDLFSVVEALFRQGASDYVIGDECESADILKNAYVDKHRKRYFQ